VGNSDDVGPAGHPVRPHRGEDPRRTIRTSSASDDGGKTWKKGGVLGEEDERMPTRRAAPTGKPAVEHAQLPRQETAGRVATSKDGGLTWSDVDAGRRADRAGLSGESDRAAGEEERATRVRLLFSNPASTKRGEDDRAPSATTRARRGSKGALFARGGRRAVFVPGRDEGRMAVPLRARRQVGRTSGSRWARFTGGVGEGARIDPLSSSLCVRGERGLPFRVRVRYRAIHPSSKECVMSWFAAPRRYRRQREFSLPSAVSPS